MNGIAERGTDLADLTLDEVEEIHGALPQVDCPVRHAFTPGLYIREITMPAGTVVTSAIHKTRHPFIISKGRVRVVSETEGAVEYEAPHRGITEPGTRRLLLVIEETVWTTFHATDLTDVAEIAKEILEPGNPKIEAGWKQQLLEGGRR